MLLNRVNVATATIGTGAAALGAAASSYQTWAGAGAVDGQSYSYLILDTAGAWELGHGVYSSSADTLTRPGPGADTSFHSSTGALLALSGAATIACVANVLDYPGSGGGGGSTALAGVTALHLTADTAIGGGWTPVVGLTVDHDPLSAYPADTGVVTVPAGVNYARVTAQLAWDNKGGTRLFAVAAPGGVSGASYTLIGHMSAAPSEGLQAATGAIVAVAPGQTYNFYVLSENSGDHLTGSGSGNFGGPSRFLIEWFSAYPGAAG